MKDNKVNEKTANPIFIPTIVIIGYLVFDWVISRMLEGQGLTGADSQTTSAYVSGVISLIGLMTGILFLVKSKRVWHKISLTLYTLFFVYQAVLVGIFLSFQRMNPIG